MIKKIKFLLIIIIGILSGLTIHGFLEVLSIWILLNWLSDLFFRISLDIWIRVDLISFVVIEVLTLIAACLIYLKYEK